MDCTLRIFNAVGSPFSHTSGGHTGFSTHGKIPITPWQWVYDNSASSTFYMEGSLPDALHDTRSLKKYGMIIESIAISSEPYLQLQHNFAQYIEIFDAIFTHSEELVAMHEKIHWIPASGIWVKDYGIHTKSKLVSMICSSKTMCSGHLDRLKWIEKFRGEVDLFGREFNFIKTKEEGLNEYMFSFAMENVVYDSHFTEKILDCFVTGTIPVYVGTRNISHYFDPDGIIFLDDNFDMDSLTPELYHSKMKAVINNYNLAQQYSTLEDYIETSYFQK